MNCKFLLVLDQTKSLNSKMQIWRTEPNISLKNAMLKYFSKGDSTSHENTMTELNKHNEVKIPDVMAYELANGGMFISQLVENVDSIILITSELELEPHYTDNG